MGFSVAAARDGLAVRGFHRMLMTAARGPRVTHVWPNRASSALARARAQFHIGGAGARVRRLQPAKRRLGAIGMPVNALSEWLVVRGSTRLRLRTRGGTSFWDVFEQPQKNPNEGSEVPPSYSGRRFPVRGVQVVSNLLATLCDGGGSGLGCVGLPPASLECETPA